MKRYELTRGFDGLMNEDDQGEWVKYKDIKNLILPHLLETKQSLLNLETIGIIKTGVK